MTVRTPIVKDRILLHLLDYLKFREAYDVPPEMTQAGIAQAVWIDVRHVLQYVRPLMEEGLLREESAHILGGQRRRKVYHLTDAGRLKSYGLRERLKSETVQVRVGVGIQEATIAEVLRKAKGQISIVDVLRESIHAGSVDLLHLETTPRPALVRMISDAPGVEGFLGREGELEVLTGERNLPRIFVVRGVAGIGKSTLAAKVCEHYRDASHLFWHRVRPWDTPQSLLAALGSFMSALGRPTLKDTVETGPPGTAHRVFEENLPGIRALFVFDDAHDGSVDLIDFLRFLKDAVRKAEDVRVLVLTRQEILFYDRRDVGIEGLVQEMTLQPLEAEVVRDLHPALRGDSALAELGRHPLFLRLLLALPEHTPPVQIRRDIHKFIEEAIYVELADAERNLMKLASLYRVPVTARALFRDVGSSYDVLMNLVGRSLLTPVGTEEFEVHDSIRDFFGMVLTNPERKDLQGYAVEQLLALAAEAERDGRLNRRIDFLANALELATRGSERAPVCEALGDARQRVGDLTGTLESYEGALAAVRQARPRARLHAKIAHVLTVQGEKKQASRVLEEGFQSTIPTASVESGWLILEECRHAIRQEEYEEAAEAGRASLNTFQAFDDVLGQGQAFCQLAHIENIRPKGSPLQAQENLEAALALADAIDDPDFTAMVHSTLAELFGLRLGKTREALVHLDAGEALYDPTVDSYGRANFIMLKALIALSQEGDFHKAETLFREARSLAGKLESKAMAAYSGYGLAQAAFFRGAFEEARARFERFALDMEQAGLPSAVESLCIAAECALLERDLAGFRGLARAVGDPELALGVEVRPLHSKVIGGIDAFLNGEWEDSRARFEEAIALARERYPGEAFPYLHYGIVLRVAGKEPEASQRLEAATSIMHAFSRQAELGILPERQRLLTEALTWASTR